MVNRNFQKERVKELGCLLQDRIDAMYVDKLEGRISEAFFTRKSEEWGAEQADILRKIEQHHNANRSYFEEGTRLLELAQKSVTLYDKSGNGRPLLT